MIFKLILNMIGLVLACIGMVTSFALIIYIFLYLFDNIDGDKFKKYFIRCITVFTISLIGIFLIDWVI